LGYYENRTEKDCIELTTNIKRNKMLNSKNSYCFIEFTCEGKFYGRYIIELFANDLPITSKNFLELCVGKNKNKFGESLTYLGTTVNRVVKDGYIQLGDLKRIGVSNFIYIYYLF
jgi:hypothetical protein